MSQPPIFHLKQAYLSILKKILKPILLLNYRPDYRRLSLSSFKQRMVSSAKHRFYRIALFNLNRIEPFMLAAQKLWSLQKIGN